MIFGLSPVSVFNVIAGGLLVLLGIFIATLRPRRRATVALAVFTVGSGLGWAANYVDPVREGEGADAVPLGLFAIGLIAAALALVELSRSFPRSGGPRDRSPLVAAIIGGLIYLAFNLADFREIAGNFGDHIAVVSIKILFFAAFNFAILLLGLRYAAAVKADEADAARGIAWLSFALIPYPGIAAGLVEKGRSPIPYEWVNLAFMVLVAAVWLRNASIAPADARWTARGLAFLSLAAPFANAIISSTFGWDAAATWTPGVVRTLVALLLAYAILRRQLLGLDLKVKWTLKQSTVAASFVAVFFAASEGTQQFVAEGVGPWVGIGAAALLVFAIHPLQNLAQRVADKAMPGVKGVGEMLPDERSRVYRDAARQAWADGSVGRDERALLDRLRHSLGLTAEDAMTIESEAARGVA